MEMNKTTTEVFEEIKEKELDFLPEDDEIRENFMTLLKFLMLSS